MKQPYQIQYVIALLLSVAASADDRATIIGGIADGTPPPPAPVKELPEVQVRETIIRELPDRTVTINRVALDLSIGRRRLTIAGKCYRVRIVIADAKDGRLDSAIFVEENSIRTVDPKP